MPAVQHAEDEVRQVAERPLVELAARLICHGGGHGDEWMELVGVATGQANQRAKPINACYVMYVCHYIVHTSSEKMELHGLSSGARA